jgi:hypothetical protein
MTAKPQTGRTDDSRPTQERQTSPPKELQEATRIAALLRDRFGTEDRRPADAGNS